MAGSKGRESEASPNPVVCVSIYKRGASCSCLVWHYQHRCRLAFPGSRCVTSSDGTRNQLQQLMRTTSSPESESKRFHMLFASEMSSYMSLRRIYTVLMSVCIYDTLYTYRLPRAPPLHRTMSRVLRPKMFCFILG